MRELSDGRVLLIDSLERKVLLVDARLTTITELGRRGSGPGELLEPAGIVMMRGDTSAIRDGGSGSRLLLILPNGTVGTTLASTGASDAAVQQGVARTAAGDRLGGLYASTVPALIPGARNTRDSSVVVRWTREAPTPRLIGYVPRQPPPGAVVTAGGTRAYAAPINVPFWTVPQWAASPDGRVAIAHHNPYRVELFDSTGRRVADARPSHDPVRVTAAHRAEWMTWYEAFLRADNLDYRAPAEWPEFLPPFLPGALQFDMDGRLWIQKTTGAGAPATFDVLDNSARLVERVTIPSRTKLVGLGANGTVYLARMDDVDLTYLERHRIMR